jgi:hypothetical protein
MHIGIDEAAKIYAKACRAWYGPRAQTVVRRKVDEMHARGDESGVQAWRLVAEELEHEHGEGVERH